MEIISDLIGGISEEEARELGLLHDDLSEEPMEGES